MLLFTKPPCADLKEPAMREWRKEVHLLHTSLGCLLLEDSWGRGESRPPDILMAGTGIEQRVRRRLIYQFPFSQLLYGISVL